MTLHDLVGAGWWVIPLALGVLFAGPFIWKCVHVAKLRRQLAEAKTSLASWEPASTEPSADGPLQKFVRPFLVQEERTALPKWRNARLIVNRELDSIVEAHIEHETSGFLYSVGSAATGVALLCTFGLIAYVLSTDIREALTASGGDAEQKLAAAVGLLGQKFAISATGILLALAFSFANAQLRKGLGSAAHELCDAVAGHFATPETLAAASQIELLAETRDVRAVLAATRADIAKLQSIDVSLKSIGAEVSHELRQMISKDIGEQIKEILTEVMSQAADLTEKMQKQLIDAFQRTLQTELPKIVGSLEDIRKSVDGQAALPVERMLEQLQSVVSGGIRGESAQMSAALKQFGEVVPALADQLRTMTASLSTELSSRAQESAQTTEALMRQVTGLLTRMEEQQAASERSVEQISRASTAGAEAMVQRLEATSGEFVTKLLQTSRDEIDALAVRMKEAANSNASGYATLGENVAEASKSIMEARDGLAHAAVAMRSLATEVHSVGEETRKTTESSQLAAKGFENAATLLRSGVASMERALEVARTQTTEQRAVLEEHRRMLKELEEAWPRLFQVYLDSFDKKSETLAQSWDNLYQKVRSLSDTTANGLVNAADELKDSVESLARLAKNGSQGDAAVSGRRA